MAACRAAGQAGRLLWKLNKRQQNNYQLVIEDYATVASMQMRCPTPSGKGKVFAIQLVNRLRCTKQQLS
jgi:hypothetical protein